MFDDLLDAFERNGKNGARRSAQGGLLGKIGRLLEGGDEPEQRRDERRLGSGERWDRVHNLEREAEARRGFGFDEDEDHDRGRLSRRARRDFDLDFGD